MKNKIKKIKIGDISFRVNKNCFPKKVSLRSKIFTLWTIYYWKLVGKNFWEPETFKIFKKFLDKKHPYIDMGAWIGPTVLYGSQIAKHCYAIEPDPIAFKKLKENIELNPKLKKKITVHEIAITNKTGKILFGNSKDTFGDSMSSILFADSKKSFYVKSMKFDDFIKKNKIKDLNFIKIDIEGGEAIVLPNMKNYLIKNKPTIHLSLHPFWFKNLKKDSKKIIDSIRGYKNYFDNKGRKITLEKIYSNLIKKKLFDIVVTDKEWN